MPEISLVELLFAAFALLAAGLVHGTLGIGFPLVATPLLAMIFDVRVAILVTLVPTVSVNIVSIVREGRWQRSVRDYVPMAFSCFGGGLLGAYALVVLDPAPFKLVLAAIILLYLYADKLSSARLFRLPANRTAGMLVFGLLAGLSAGAVNVMVPILVIYALEAGLDRGTMIPMFNFCFLCGKLAQISTFSTFGLLNVTLLWVTAIGAAIAVTALIVGMAVRSRISADTYVRWLRYVLLVGCIVLVVEYIVEV